MRITFGKLQTKCLQYTQNINNSDANLTTFIKDEINITTRFIYAELSDFITSKTQTATSIANQQYYHLPPDYMSAKTATIQIGGITYPLREVESQKEWDRMNAITIQATIIPRYYFVRRDDFGIWPIPQGAYTITFNYTYRLKDMTQDDYATGTISLTNASQTVTGSSTTFTAAMVGRWLIPTTDQYPYRISAYSSATSLTLENYFQGSTISGDAYTIGETPEIPGELHELIPYRVASNYFSGIRKNKDMATYWSNMFWTGDPQNDSRDLDRAIGGLLGAKKRYSKRTNSHIISHKTTHSSFTDRIWGTTLS